MLFSSWQARTRTERPHLSGVPTTVAPTRPHCASRKKATCRWGDVRRLAEAGISTNSGEPFCTDTCSMTFSLSSRACFTSRSTQKTFTIALMTLWASLIIPGNPAATLPFSVTGCTPHLTHLSTLVGPLTRGSLCRVWVLQFPPESVCVAQSDPCMASL